MAITLTSYIQADEVIIGENHPEMLEDSINRPIKDLIQKLNSGTDIPTQWDNIQNKPSPQITITLIGDVTGETSVNQNLDGNTNISINAQIATSLPIKAAVNPTITTNPAVVGQQWINYVTGEIFICTNITVDANVWVGTSGTLIP